MKKETEKDNFFGMLKALYSKEPIVYDEKVLNQYLMILWVSHDKDNFHYVEAIARYLFVIKPKYIWQYLRHKLPMNRNKFLKYVKKDKLQDDMIEELCIEHGWSKYEAMLNVNLQS